MRLRINTGKGEIYALIDDGDYTIVNAYKWFINPQGYVWAHDYSKGWRAKAQVLLHRLLLPPPKGQTVDHIDRNPLNNRRDNLRIATYSQQNMNTRTRSDNTTGHRGVYWEKRRNCWRVCINLNGKQIHVGQFKDKQRAILAREAKAKELYGDFA